MWLRGMFFVDVPASPPCQSLLLLIGLASFVVCFCFI